MPLCKKRQREISWKHPGEGNSEMEAETGVMPPQAKGHLQSQETAKDKN